MYTNTKNKNADLKPWTRQALSKINLQKKLLNHWNFVRVIFISIFVHSIYIALGTLGTLNEKNPYYSIFKFGHHPFSSKM
jgi:hypothetical protein